MFDLLKILGHFSLDVDETNKMGHIHQILCLQKSICQITNFLKYQTSPNMSNIDVCCKVNENTSLKS